MVAAFLVNLRSMKVRGFFQIAYYTPAVISSVVAAAIWLLIFDPRGLGNQWVNAILNTPGVDRKWLADRTMVQVSTMIVYFWKYIGYFVVLFITGLSAIPPAIYEAATIDGSSKWQAFWRITLPLLKPTVVLVSIMAMLQCLKTFSTQYLFVQGGAPRAPINVITLNIYTTGIRNQRIGRASAMSIVLFPDDASVHMDAVQVLQERRSGILGGRDVIDQTHVLDIPAHLGGPLDRIGFHRHAVALHVHQLVHEQPADRTDAIQLAPRTVLSGKLPEGVGRE
jgi:ABC-type spermidine/putrescine transport system permease subunit I